MIGAALGVALFLCAGLAAAQDISIRSPNGALSLTGRFIGYDGTYLQIETAYGPLTLNYAQVTCTGALCPDPEAYVPRVRLSGSSRMTDVLMPALIRAFATARGYDAKLETIDATHFEVALTDADAGVAIFAFRATTASEGFADLVAHEADIALSVREATPSEVAIAREVGIGTLTDPAQSRILGTDAMLVIASPRQTVTEITLRDLAAAYAGQITTWAALGGGPEPINLHLPDAQSGLAQRVTNDLILNSGRLPAETIQYHANLQDLAQAVADDPFALGITGFGQTGIARQLTLRGVCGTIAVPRVTTLKTNDYPLTSPLYIYLPKRRQHPVVRDFLAWMRSPAAHLVVRRSGFVDQGILPISLDAQGQRFAIAIAAAGAEVPLTSLQRMIAVMRDRTRLSVSFRFDAGTDAMNAQSRANLLSLGQSIKDGDFAGRSLMLIGFSDGQGAAAENLALSQARAEAVAGDLRALFSGSLPHDTEITTRGFGEALPIGCDETIWGRNQNRRVELWVGD